MDDDDTYLSKLPVLSPAAPVVSRSEEKGTADPDYEYLRRKLQWFPHLVAVDLHHEDRASLPCLPCKMKIADKLVRIVVGALETDQVLPGTFIGSLMYVT